MNQSWFFCVSHFSSAILLLLHFVPLCLVFFITWFIPNYQPITTAHCFCWSAVCLYHSCPVMFFSRILVWHPSLPQCGNIMFVLSFSRLMDVIFITRFFFSPTNNKPYRDVRSLRKQCLMFYVSIYLPTLSFLYLLWTVVGFLECNEVSRRFLHLFVYYVAGIHFHFDETILRYLAMWWVFLRSLLGNRIFAVRCCYFSQFGTNQSLSSNPTTPTYQCCSTCLIMWIASNLTFLWLYFASTNVFYSHISVPVLFKVGKFMVMWNS